MFDEVKRTIANCLTNANYYERRGIVCVWYDDCITIENPGDFRMPVEEAMKPGKSDPRNETMLKMFSWIQIGERAGSGVPNMVAQWMSCGYGKPVLSEEYDPEVSTVLLPLSTDSDNLDSDNSLKNIVRISRKSTQENEGAIVGFLADHEGARSLEIAEAVGISRTRVNQLLRSLIEGGTVEAVGGSCNRTYRIAD